MMFNDSKNKSEKLIYCLLLWITSLNWISFVRLLRQRENEGSLFRGRLDVSVGLSWSNKGLILFTTILTTTRTRAIVRHALKLWPK